MEPRRLLELSRLFAIAAAVLLVLALASYDPADLTESSGRTRPGTENLVGWPGVWLAWTCQALFGKIAYALPVLCLLVALGFGRSSYLLFWAKGGVLVLLCATFYSLLLLTVARDDKQAIFAAGGVLGFYFGQLMLVFGPAGSYVVLSTLILAVLLVSTNILFGELARRTASFAHDHLRVRVEPRESAPSESTEPAPTRRGRMLRPEPDRALPAPKPRPKPAPTPVCTLERAEEVEIILDPGLVPEDDEPIVLRVDGSFSQGTQVDEPPVREKVRSRASPKAPSAEDSSQPVVRDTLVLESEPTVEVRSDPELVISTKMSDSPPPLELRETPEREIPSAPVVTLPPVEDDTLFATIPAAPPEPFRLPSLSLLDPPPPGKPEILREEIDRTCEVIRRTFEEFDIAARVVEVNYGPVITRYQISPPPGVRLSRITGLADNLAMNLRAESVRVEAPIPGKGTVGIEVPNKTRTPVSLAETLASSEFRQHRSPLSVALGKTIEGEPFVADLATMPHLLIAGATGAGKSVCINTIITSILFNNTPDDVKFLMVDPKRVELQLYADIPHLLYPVITDPKLAGGVLKWAVNEMEFRYECLSRLGCRSIAAYNKKRQAEVERTLAHGQPEPESRQGMPVHMPYIVLIIDELADLMMVCRQDVEASVQRLAQMARAVGIHLVLATQRPSVNVITGVIKANLPTRIAFQVSSKIDSRTILDENGAEALLGKGDMLFRPGGAGKPVRVQGAFVSTEEVERVVQFICAQRKPDYHDIRFEVEEADGAGSDDEPIDDDLYEEAVRVVLEHDAASTSLLQRRLKIGYGRAARLLDIMEARGIVGPARGSKPREILSSGGIG